MSCVVQHRVPHQAPWFCCAPALFSPRWHSVFEARLPLAPGLFGAHRGFDSPAAPSNCLPWWTSRAVTLEGQRSVASRCVPSHYCYDCWEEKTNKLTRMFLYVRDYLSGAQRWNDWIRARCCSLPSQSSPGVKGVWVLWRSGGGLRWRRRLKRRVTIEAGCPW